MYYIVSLKICICGSWDHRVRHQTPAAKLGAKFEVQRTLRENPSFRRLIRFLHLPNSRERFVITPNSVLELSAVIVAASTLVYSLDVQQHASGIFLLN